MSTVTVAATQMACSWDRGANMGRAEKLIREAANVMPVVASNRVGTEQGEKYTMTFYGSSFIASYTGEIVAQADRSGEGVLTAAFDLEAVRRYRQAWGVFRDRRPDLYHPIMSLDGRG